MEQTRCDVTYVSGRSAEAGVVGPPRRRDQDQALDRGLPFGGVRFFLWEFRRVGCCISQGNELAAIRQHNRIFGRSTMFARIGVMRALNRHAERVLIRIAKNIIGESGSWRGIDDGPRDGGQLRSDA
jgi:hypothetical protein